MNKTDNTSLVRNKFIFWKGFFISRMPVMAMVVCTIGVGLLSRYGLTGFWAKYLGVALWATMVYFFVMLVKPSMKVYWVLSISLIISWGVEFLQLTPGPAFLSSKHILLRLIFGSHFSVFDLPAYLVGIVLGALIHLFYNSLVKKDGH
jgi:Protein of unknown function (DUF2809)